MKLRLLLAGVLIVVAPVVFAQRSIPATDSVAPGRRPEDVGMSAERLGRVKAAMQRYVDRRDVAGTVTLIARHGRVVHLETTGYRDVDAKAPMTADTLFRIASIPIAEFRHHPGRPLASGKPAIDVRMFGRHPDAANSLPLDQSPARGLRETLDRLASPQAGWNGPTRSWSRMPLGRLQQSSQRQRSWIGRHPVLFGTAVGFGAGFLIGYLPGDDGIFEDQNAAFSAWVLGGVGAGVGALVGALVR